MDIAESLQRHEWKGLWWAWLLHVIGPFYLAFVVLNLWNWFVVEAIHGSTLSYGQAFGFVLIGYAVSFRDADNKNWKKVFVIVNGCVRDDKQVAVDEAVAGEEKKEWLIDLVVVAIRFGIYTVILGIGWGIRNFLM
jgi:hypothetical protein